MFLAFNKISLIHKEISCTYHNARHVSIFVWRVITCLYTLPTLSAIIMIHTCTGFSRASHNCLCQEDTASSNTKGQRTFDTHFAFLRCNELTDFTAKVIFSYRFSPFCRCFCSGKIGFPNGVGNTISRTNTIAVGVKPSPWTCFLMSFQKAHHSCWLFERCLSNSCLVIIGTACHSRVGVDALGICDYRRKSSVRLRCPVPQRV